MAGAESSAAPCSVSSCADSDILPVSSSHVLRLTLVQSGQKSARSSDDWRLSGYESCITCSAGCGSLRTDSCVHLPAPSSDGSGVPDSPVDQRYLSKKRISSAFADSEAIIFVNCCGILEAVGLYGPVERASAPGGSVLIAASCRSIGLSSATPAESSDGYLLVFEVGVTVVSPASEVSEDGCFFGVHKPRLLMAYPLKGRVCVCLEWLDARHFASPIAQVASPSASLLFLLFDDGSVMLCKLNGLYNDGPVAGVSTASAVPCDSFDVLWHYEPFTEFEGQQLTCMSVSYTTVSGGDTSSERKPECHPAGDSDPLPIDSDGDHRVLRLAACTNDGFLLLWSFWWSNVSAACSSASPRCVSSAVRPFSSKVIPLFLATGEPPACRRVVSCAFLPYPESYLLAIASYMGTVVLWDVRHGRLEGEVRTYQSSSRPLTCVRWSRNVQHLLIGGPGAFFIQWQLKSALSALPYDKGGRVRYEGVFDNVCWCVDSTDNTVCFCYDDGLFVEAPVLSVTRRHAHDLATTYLWEPSIKEGHDQSASEEGLSGCDMLSRVSELSSRQFSVDLSFVRENGVTVTRNGSKYRGGRVGKSRDSRLLRSKVFSHHCVRAHVSVFCGIPVSFVAYGGNAGVLHVLVKH